MELHGALNDYKRSRGDPHRFPGERRTTTGLFSGLDDRLVHVAPDGSLRDYSYPLTGLAGLERSRFGLELDGEIRWFDGGEQRYVDGTAVVETTRELAGHTYAQYDLTVGRLHLTHVTLEQRGESTEHDESSGTTDSEDGTPTLLGCFGFAPDGRASRIGQLWHDGVVEVHHDSERDFLAASTPVSVTGQIPERFDELLASEPTAFPRAEDDERYEEAKLSPIAMIEVDLEGAPPSATVATLLSTDEDRVDALEAVRTGAHAHGDREAILEAGREQARERLPDSVAGVDRGFEDLRALALLRAPTGARIAGPEFDPFYRYSGGYGYTWFRDDAEIARFLLETDRRADLGLESWHAASARFYAETQRADGTWPHRVWPHNGELAPGWAHGRVERGETDSGEYQADQTASVAAFLATYLRRVDPDDDRVRETLEAAFEGLNATLEDDGLPSRVQNAWENMTGRFTHTAATYLEAYAAIAQAPVDDEIAERARENARAVYEAVDVLWVADRGCYALRLDDGERDDRLDGSTLALASAHRAYDDLVGVAPDRLDRLVSHVETTLDGLYRDPEGPVEGLARFEGDPWRVREQDEPKIWTVTTAWGARAAAELGAVLAGNDREEAAPFDERARTLLALVGPGGPLRRSGGYLPEQVFDDGTPDSATPLGWPHALRLATASALEAVAAARLEDSAEADQAAVQD